jgi:hypothetical protein
MVKEGDREFSKSGIYHSGKNPPRQGSVPEGFEWQPVIDRWGNATGGHRLVPSGPVESRPPEAFPPGWDDDLQPPSGTGGGRRPTWAPPTHASESAKAMEKTRNALQEVGEQLTKKKD